MQTLLYFKIGINPKPSGIMQDVFCEAESGLDVKFINSRFMNGHLRKSNFLIQGSIRSDCSTP